MLFLLCFPFCVCACRKPLRHVPLFLHRHKSIVTFFCNARDRNGYYLRFLWHGLGFLKLFVPEGVPGVLMPLVVMIEVISFLSRPISLSVRLFANMLAGHITLKVFAGFIVSMGSMGFLGFLGAALPLAMTVALTGLEFLVAFLQAYVFAVLSCMYLNDALHPSH